MRGKISKDYLGIWRWENLKKAWGKGAWWPDFYMVFVLPVLFSGVWEDSHVIRYSLCALPLVCERLESVILPMGLSKIQYLCPMTEQERKAHIIGMYWLKVLIPLAVFSVGQAVYVGFRWVHPVCAAACVIIFLFLAMILQINPMFSKEVKERQFAGFHVWQNGAGISGVIVFIVSYVFEDAIWQGSISVPIVIYGILVVWQALLTGKVMTYFAPIVEAALYYENVSGERPKGTWTTWR